MPKHLTIAAAQTHTLHTTAQTLSSLKVIANTAKDQGVDILLFPEAYLGGYPRTCNFGSAVGSRDLYGRDQFLSYFQSAVDLGDTPQSAGDDWVDRKLKPAFDKKYRGDGTREFLETVARESGVFLAVGAIERAGGSLYCAVLYICPRLGCIGKRRKVLPTGTERLIWAQGSTSTLRAVVTRIKGVDIILAAAICWENYMPLLRQSLYSQNVNLYLAPTADARDTWLSCMRTIACEGRCFVISANMCTKNSDLPDWIARGTEAVPSDKGETHKTQASQESPATFPNPVAAPSIPTAKPTDAETTAQSAMTASSVMELITFANNTNQTPTQTIPPPIKRRTSIISKTADGHEISWPLTPSTSNVVVPNTEEEIEVTQNQALEEVNAQMKSYESTVPPSAGTTNGESHGTPQAPGSKARNVESEDDFICRGGSCIIGPLGEVLAGPLWEAREEVIQQDAGDGGNPKSSGAGLLIAKVDFEDCERGRLDLDVAGSYSRNDAFKFSVVGLDIDPPPI